MSGRRNVLVVGGLAGVGAAYYLYNAGGDPKLAEKKFEHDAARLSSTIKNDLPGKGKEMKTQAKLYGQEAGAKLDSAVDAARRKADGFDTEATKWVRNAENKLVEVKHDASKSINSAINEFDNRVSSSAARVRDGMSQSSSELRDKAARGVAGAAGAVQDEASRVESEANKQKSSGLSSWFGGSK